jgi:hypothetical protein
MKTKIRIENYPRDLDVSNSFEYIQKQIEDSGFVDVPNMMPDDLIVYEFPRVEFKYHFGIHRGTQVLHHLAGRTSGLLPVKHFDKYIVKVLRANND